MSGSAARQETFEAVVLAAGRSERFGAAKLVAPFEGGRLIDGALRAAFEDPADRVLLVVGAHRAPVEAAARAFAARTGTAGRLAVVPAERAAEGLSASLAAGLAAVSPRASGAFILLADMPRLPSGVLSALAQALGTAEAAAPVQGGRRGHPVLLRRSLFAPLLAGAGDQGARRLLDGLGDRLALWPTEDAGVHLDIDRPADLAAAGGDGGAEGAQ